MYRINGTLSRKTQKEIAEEIKVSEQSICAWKKNEEFQRTLKEYFDEQWKDLAKDAQKRIGQLLYSTNDSVALGASKYVLDSYGRGATQQIDITSKGKTLIAKKVSDAD